MDQTAILALWGAITGTLGTFAGLFSLWLRFRQHRLDKTKLRGESWFGFTAPEKTQHKITLRCIGRRPISIDGIQYCVAPPYWHQRITQYWQQKTKQPLCFQKIKNTRLLEGEKIDIRIRLPDDIDITEIYKAYAIDQTGKRWSISWLAKEKLHQMTSEEMLAQYMDETSDRSLAIACYRLGKRFYLQASYTLWPTETLPYRKHFWFSDQLKAQRKFTDLVQKQARPFLLGETDKIY